jgi:predicted DNA-binding transcriptional regulator YafY
VGHVVSLVASSAGRVTVLGPEELRDAVVTELESRVQAQL